MLFKDLEVRFLGKYRGCSLGTSAQRLMVDGEEGDGFVGLHTVPAPLVWVSGHPSLP